MLDTVCVIFAGGKSSRMGKDKALLPFAGFDTLTEYQYTRLSKIFKTVYISTKDISKFGFKANFIQDIQNTNTYAPTLGFVSSFKHLDTDSFFAISVDAPFISKEDIQKIYDADSKIYDATVASTKNTIEPLCGIYHKSLEDKFQKMLDEDNHKLRYLLKNSNTKIVDFKNDNNFLNLNHPDEYEKALQIINTSLV
jgi:molybdopterin-guanine dinucleotide biosynthesis protein A